MYFKSQSICISYNIHSFPIPQIKVSPKHEGLIYGGFEVEDMIGHCQVVFQSEGLQHDAIPHWESKPQLIVFCWRQ